MHPSPAQKKEPLNKNRREAFSDGVIAIMVLEIKVPHGEHLADLNLLFWLSLMPFATAWMAGKPFCRHAHG